MATDSREKVTMNRRRITKVQPPPEQKQLPCPRCDSKDTNFNFYNRHKLSKPCHFCKFCRHYWIQGGTLRDVSGAGGSLQRSRPKNLSKEKVLMEESNENIHEEREELLVSHLGVGEPVRRIGHFLTPTITFHENVPNPNPNPNPPPSDLKSEKFPVVVIYEGWRKPSPKWKKWVDYLKPKYQSVWRQAGIFEAIISSTFNVQKDITLILGLAEKWNPDTNTFVFPWGEATITLEDIHFLGNYSVIGLHFFPPFFQSTDLTEIENNLKEAKSGAGDRPIEAWLDVFMNSVSEIEHEAFLSFWLANCLFPNSQRVIKDCVFPIAVRLAKGMRFAIAPAVLASIYRDLRLLKNLLVSKSKKKLYLKLHSPLQLVQLWAWERFESLSPVPKSIRASDPRAARWDNLKVKSPKLSDIRLALESANEIFLWRPYATPVDNWEFPRFYSEKAGWIVVKPDMEEENVCFVLLSREAELVGIGKKCMELYLPHRVAMQFGFDQDVPIQVSRRHMTAEIAWENYARRLSCSKVYIPSRSSDACVTAEYMAWWKPPITNKVEGFSIEKKKQSVTVDRFFDQEPDNDAPIFLLENGPTALEMSNFHPVCKIFPHILQNDSEYCINQVNLGGGGSSSGAQLFSAVADGGAGNGGATAAGRVNAEQVVGRNVELKVPVCLNKKVDQMKFYVRRNISPLENMPEETNTHGVENGGSMKANDNEAGNSGSVHNFAGDNNKGDLVPDLVPKQDSVMVHCSVLEKFPTPMLTHCDNPTSQAHGPSTPVHGNISLLEKTPVETNTQAENGGSTRKANDNEAGISGTVEDIVQMQSYEILGFELEARIVKLERIFAEAEKFYAE